MSVENQNPLYSANLERWQTVDNVCNGTQAVKNAGIQYLPMVNACDKSQKNLMLYEAYKGRAVFFEVTKDTLQNHIGLAFSEDPSFEPDGMDFLKSDADGNGTSIYQLNQTALNGLLRRGRGGIFVDFPSLDTPVTIAEMKKGIIRPTIVYYSALNIINWRVKKIGGVFKTSLIVLSELVNEVDPTDEFSQIQVQKYRVLRLDDENIYSVQIYSNASGELLPEDEYRPKDHNGKFWNEIPFMPIGSQVNDWDIDEIPLESLALMNLAHYRNSAEYENSVFFTGQIQPVITNMDREQAREMEDKGIKLGSYTPLTLWGSATFEYIQAKETMLAKEAMKDKFDYMQALGAKVLDRTTNIKTATQVEEEAATQHSVLSLCVSNLNEASEYYLRWCATYCGFGFKAKFSIKQDFARGKVGLEEMKFYQDLVVAEDLSRKTFHEIRTTGKIPELSFDEEQLRIDAQKNI